MFVLLVVLIVVAVIALLLGLSSRQRVAAMRRASTIGCVDLPKVAGHGSPVACEVTGTTGGSGAPLRAPLSGTECVWHRVTVTHRYREKERDNKGDYRWVTKDKQVSEEKSVQPFTVTDLTGSVRIQPDGAEVVGAVASADRFEEGDGGRSPGIPGAIGALVRGDTTIGYRHREWVLPVGAQVYVLAGAVRDDAGDAWMQKPAQGPFLVSTKSEEELTRSATRVMVIAFVVAGLCAAGAVAAAVAGIVG